MAHRVIVPVNVGALRDNFPEGFHFISLLPNTVTIPAFMLNIIMCDELNVVASWRGRQYPFELEIHSWELLCHFWSHVRGHENIIGHIHFRRSLRNQIDAGLMHTRAIDVWRFDANFFNNNWDVIRRVVLLHPWIPDQFTNQSHRRLHPRPGVMYGASIEEAVERFQADSD